LVGWVFASAFSFSSVSVEVDVGGLDADVSEPESDHAGVDAGMQEPHRGGVPQDVRGDRLAAQ
jgi:hypothetical protein